MFLLYYFKDRFRFFTSFDLVVQTNPFLLRKLELGSIILDRKAEFTIRVQLVEIVQF